MFGKFDYKSIMRPQPSRLEAWMEVVGSLEHLDFPIGLPIEPLLDRIEGCREVSK